MSQVVSSFFLWLLGSSAVAFVIAAALDAGYFSPFIYYVAWFFAAGGFLFNLGIIIVNTGQNRGD